MPCPVAVGGSAFILLTGLYSVFVQDRRYRRIWWTLLLVLSAGWGSYFGFARTTSLRIALEVFSVLFFIVIELRLLRLIFVHGLTPPGSTLLARVGRITKPYTLNTVTVMLKTFILSMLVFEWIGKVDFSATWYLTSLGILCGWLLILWVFHKWGKTWIQQSWIARFIFGAKKSDGSCPLGYDKL